MELTRPPVRGRGGPGLATPTYAIRSAPERESGLFLGLPEPLCWALSALTLATGAAMMWLILIGPTPDIADDLWLGGAGFAVRQNADIVPDLPPRLPVGPVAQQTPAPAGHGGPAPDPAARTAGGFRGAPGGLPPAPGTAAARAGAAAPPARAGAGSSRSGGGSGGGSGSGSRGGSGDGSRSDDSASRPARSGEDSPSSGGSHGSGSTGSGSTESTDSKGSDSKRSGGSDD